jgi:protein-S-isoprenylcysteine O-methyltransferase Ste14
LGKETSSRLALHLNALCFGWPDTPSFALPMKQVFLSILTMLMVVATTLSAMVILVRATLYVTSIESPLPRAGAILAEILLGVVLLLGTVWLATHAAVLIFSPKSDKPEGGPLV